MGCLVILIIFAICVGGGAMLAGTVGAIIGFILALFICAKMNS